MVGTNLEVRIRERAYQIWEREGRPDGKHLEHWRRAEQEVKSQAERGVLERSIERPTSAPRMHPTSPAAAQAPGATPTPGGDLPATAASAAAKEAKRTVRSKQTLSEAGAQTKTPRTRRSKAAAPKPKA